MSPITLQSIPTFVELVKVLSHFCRNPDPDDQIAFDAAVLLGRFCIHDGNAEARLIKALEESNDTHTKAKVRSSKREDRKITVISLSSWMKTVPKKTKYKEIGVSIPFYYCDESKNGSRRNSNGNNHVEIYISKGHITPDVSVKPYKEFH